MYRLFSKQHHEHGTWDRNDSPRVFKYWQEQLIREARPARASFIR